MFILYEFCPIFQKGKIKLYNLTHKKPCCPIDIYPDVPYTYVYIM